MERKELYQNVRKAYRLAYEIQDSIVEIVEYIRTRIKHQGCAGRQLFSDPIEKYKSLLDEEADQKFGEGRWSWDYFPTYMYMYYFKGTPIEARNCCFSIVQIMDDGFIGAPKKNSAPSTKDFNNPVDSESYLLFAFSIWKNHDFIWFYRDEKKKEVNDEQAEILRISEAIKGNGYEPYVVRNDESTFVVNRINLETIGSKAEADLVLQGFAKLVQERTGYQLLVDEL
jgi:hypothetical protein